MKDAYIFDVEATGLSLNSNIHCFVAVEEESDTTYELTDTSKMGEFVCQDGVTLIGHNIAAYDIPLIENKAGIKTKATLIDTLYLSWYLYPKRLKHGLADWGEEFGVPKPKVDDWEGLTVEEYLHRCREDVKINKLLWKKQWDFLMRIYGSEEAAWKLINYLMHKARCMRLQAISKWKLDIPKVVNTKKMLEDLKAPAYEAVKAVMPSVPQFKKKKKPAKCFKKDGTLSNYGIKWFELLKERGLPEHWNSEVEVSDGEEEPNPDSVPQLKAWLFSLGWKPCTFKFVKEDKGKFREVPQVRIENSGGLLTPSVLALAETIPAIKKLEGYTILGHRVGILNGFLEAADEDGYVIAEMGGLTNTLRLKHRTLVNLPAPDKKYGADIRGCLIAPDNDHELCGSDKVALEDRTKQHWMWPYDPEYVKSMMEEGYCPHVDIAKLAGFLTEEQEARYKSGNFLSKADEKEIVAGRKAAKPVNYGGVYGQKAKGLSRSSGMPLELATKLTNIYEQRNWSLKKIADNCEVKVVDRQKWLYNPVSQLWYSLRTDKDRFSTLNQGTGDYAFNVWIKHVLKRREQLTGQFHDEIILTVKKGKREKVERMLREALADANKELKMNRELDISLDFGDNYAQIH